MVSLYYRDANLVQEVDGKGDDGEGKDIGGGGDDGRDDQDRHDGVAAVFFHKGGINYPQFAQEPSQYGKFKEYAHEQGQGDEQVCVGFQGDYVWNAGANLICAQKTESQRKYDQIVKHYSGHEQDV